MDSYLWHEQASATHPAPPPPRSRTELETMSTEARTAFATAVRTALRARTISSPIHQQVNGELTRALASALIEPAGARTILALSAPYAAGKSTLIKAWAQDRYRSWIGRTHPSQMPECRPEPGVRADHVPVCYLSLLSESKSKDLYVQLLAFVRRETPRMPERDLAIQAVRALRLHGVRLIVLDDAHMLRTSSVTGRATLNAVKHLNTELGELGGVLVLVGAELSGGEALNDPQIRGRLAEHTLRIYGAGTEDERREWQQFLRSCEAQIMAYMPNGQPGLFANRHAAYLWDRTGGFVGDTAKLLIDATVQAIIEARPLTRSHLDGVRLSERATDHLHDQEQAKAARRRRTAHQRAAG